MSDLRFILNQAAATKRETRNGREFLVVPVVAVVEGVLNGLFLSDEEIGKHFLAWNGRPFVLGHPPADNGIAGSANDQETLDRIGLGTLYNTTWADGKLRTEAWIDLAETETKGGDHIIAVKRLEAGELTDVSTAYFLDQEEGKGEFEGQPFDGIQRNLVPDHLALLLDEPGACSLDDGCGAPRINSQEDPMPPNVPSEAQTEAQRLLDAQLDGDAQSNNCLRRAFEMISNAVAILRNKGEPTLTKQEMIEKLVADGRFKLTAEEFDPLSDTGLEKFVAQLDNQDELPEDEEHPPPEENADRPPATNAQELPEPLQRLAKVFETPESTARLSALLATNQQADTEQRTALVGELVANSACRFTQERLAEMPTADLQALRQSLIVPNYSGNGQPATGGQTQEYALSKML